MPKYIIEREIPEAGKLSAQELQAISQKSCDVLQQMGLTCPEISGHKTEKPKQDFPTVCQHSLFLCDSY